MSAPLSLLQSSTESISEDVELQEEYDDEEQSENLPSQIVNPMIQNHTHLLEHTKILLNREEYPPGSLPPDFNRKFCLMMMQAWSETCNAEGASTAELILYRLEEEQRAIQGLELEQAQNTTEPADRLLKTSLYNTAINAWRSSSASDAPARAEAILDHMIELQHSQDPLDIRPDAFTYRAVITGYAKSTTEGHAQHALELLQRTIQAYRGGDIATMPSMVTVSCVLEALAESKEPGAAEEAEKLLRSLRDPEESGLEKVTLDAICYMSVMNAYARAASPEKAEAIFLLMKKDYEDGNAEAKPTNKAYTVLLKAWVLSKMEGRLERAESILRRMETAEDSDIRPDAVSYATVMNGWAKLQTSEALDKVEDLFNNIVSKGGIKPDNHCYTAYLRAAATSGRRDAAWYAEKILREMYNEFRSGENEEAKPNTAQITMVMDCWGKSRDPNAGEKAEKILDWMLEIYHTSKDESFKPNDRTYNVAINAWSRSRHVDKANRARAVLDKMIDLYESGESDAKPNMFVYTGVLNACAYTTGGFAEKMESFKLASTTFRDLCSSEYGDPNHVTYGTFVKACDNLIPKGDPKVNAIKAIFKRCCQDGQVSDFVMERIELALTTQQLQDLLGEIDSVLNRDGTVDMESLPPEWKANTKDVKPRRKQQPADSGMSREVEQQRRPPRTVKIDNRIVAVDGWIDEWRDEGT